MATPRLVTQVGARQVKAKEDKADTSQVSQWTLMRRRFYQSKLSVAGLIALVIMYLMALLAPFLSPYNYDELDNNYKWAAPSTLTWSGRPAICGVTQTMDNVNFEFTYQKDCSKAVPIQWFVKGYPYRIMGIFNSDRHLFGVSQENLAPDQAPPKIFIWGADSQGRDLFSRVLQGARVSLSIGLLGVLFSTLIGAVLGTASGYFGGAIDNIMQRVIELLSSIPTLPLWAAIAAALPHDMPVETRFLYITLVLSLLGWTGLARQVRGKVMSYRTADYTSAARLAGSSHSRIILTHMLPNALSHIIVVAALAVPAAILGETALSFLGLGMLPPAVSWGVLLRDAQQVQAVTTYPWLMIPGAAVILAVLCYQLLGDGLRDAVDPYG
jgi:peptide/nickel transport system permease protein